MPDEHVPMNAATVKLWSREVKRLDIDPVAGDIFYPNGWYEEYVVYGTKFHLGGKLGDAKHTWGAVIRKHDWSKLPSCKS